LEFRVTRKIKVDSFPVFPHVSAVHAGSLTCLTSEIETGSGVTTSL
jgi:hypothetical protein